MKVGIKRDSHRSNYLERFRADSFKGQVGLHRVPQCSPTHLERPGIM